MFDNVLVQTIDWSNEHGTCVKRGVKRFLPVASPSMDLITRWRRVGTVLQDIVGHAFESGEQLRPDGSRWSLSNIAQPSKLALSMAIHDVAEEVPQGWRSAAYGAFLEASSLVPMLVSGSMKIHRLNRLLTLRHLALQTSGASDGQTIGGASATGTHGAALRLGAFHDTLRALHFMVAPKQAVLIQPSSMPLVEQAEADLGHWFGFPTQLINDDALFQAAQVHLGAFGVLLNAVVECEPLYILARTDTPHTDDKWKGVLQRQDTVGIAGHRPQPVHLQVVINPYKPTPATAPRAWVQTMSKTRYTGQAGVLTDPGVGVPPNPDLLEILATLAGLDDVGLGTAQLRKRTTSELVSRYGTVANTKKALPGVMFGPTSLPRGRGDSAELVVAGADALQATEAILGVFDQQLRAGRQFLGAVGIRFVKGSAALLAPNARDMSCYIELPAIRTTELKRIYAECGKALNRRGIAFGCHWGQHLIDQRNNLASWWGNQRVQDWRAARREVLRTEKASSVFESAVLASLGLT